jgi:lysophospholipase L1-like esterase
MQARAVRFRLRLAAAAWAAAAVAAAIACGLFPGAARAQAPADCGSTHWVGAWAADPVGALGAGYADQTLRILLTPHVGGSRLRVHISNRYGSGPLRIARASVGLRQSGAALVAASSRLLRFAGASAVTIPAGGEAVSDPADLTFAAFEDLAVSLYLDDPTGPATGHLTGRERSYTTAGQTGDHTADQAGDAFVASTTTVSYVDAVDVLEPASVAAAVLFGDSLTDGYENAGAGGSGEDRGGIDLNHRYPDFLARRLLAEPGGPRVSVVNAGISGNSLLTDGVTGLGGPTGVARSGADVLGVAGVTDAIVLEGTNDIAVLATADQITAALGQIVTRLRAAGLHVLIGTIPPAGTGLLNLGSLGTPVYIESAYNVIRVAVNRWIRSGASGADGIVDFDAALRGTVQPNELDPSLDSGDHLHPSYLGYARMAAAVDLADLRGGARCGEASQRMRTTLHARAAARPVGRLRLTGSLVTAPGVDCAGVDVVVRALRAGHTVLKRRVRLTAACRFATTRALGLRGRIEVRVGFPGSPTLLPSRARAIHLTAR